jgi:hypothetical protein
MNVTASSTTAKRTNSMKLYSKRPGARRVGDEDRYRCASSQLSTSSCTGVFGIGSLPSLPRQFSSASNRRASRRSAVSWPSVNHA